MSTREITHRYDDPLDLIWTTAAERMGFRVTRSANVYASTDGRGTLIIGTDETLDADDSLAQMIFHELCHSLVEGLDSLDKEDWGLANQDDRHTSREYACLRLQAALGAPHGLRYFFAPTTDHRAFFDALGDDPLAPHYNKEAVLARRGLTLSEFAPWGPHLQEALAATAQIARETARFSPKRMTQNAASLWAQVTPPLPLHATGFPIAQGDRANESCGTCAWLGEKRGKPWCKQAEVQIDRALGACERWESPFDCQSCGACCREAYGAVDITKRDPFIKKHRSLVVVRTDGSLGVARNGERCTALTGGTDEAPKYACSLYEDRPRTCREFTLGSMHCRTARRRVGLTR